jgi:hypothetical protein
MREDSEHFGPSVQVLPSLRLSKLHWCIVFPCTTTTQVLKKRFLMSSMRQNDGHID